MERIVRFLAIPE